MPKCQSSHSHRQLSPIQVRHSPIAPPAERQSRAIPGFAIKYVSNPRRDASGTAQAPTCATARPAAVPPRKHQLAPIGASVGRSFTQPSVALPRVRCAASRHYATVSAITSASTRTGSMHCALTCTCPAITPNFTAMRNNCTPSLMTYNVSAPSAPSIGWP